MRRGIAIIALIALTGAAAACTSDASAPVAVDNAMLARGAIVYESSCASCHGTDLRGTEKGPSHLSVVYEPNHHGDDSFRSAIANGAPQHHWNFGPMAAVPGLEAEDVDAVIAFVRAEQERQGFDS